MRHFPSLVLVLPLFGEFVLFFFYQNISSCVVNNGFATGHFSIQRGVRQGDPLSPYLFIIVLEVLATRIRGDPRIRGVNVNGNDIKLQIFSDDLTGFVRNEQSFNRFIDTTEEFGKRSGLRINYDKTEILFIGNHLPKCVDDEIEIRKVKVKVRFPHCMGSVLHEII